MMINDDFSKLLDDSQATIRLAIFARLFRDYTKLLGKDKAKFLAVAVLNEAIVEEPSNSEAKQFYESNRSLIIEESLKLCQNKKLAEAFSYLYAAQIIYLAYTTRNPIPERATQLSDRATELSLYIANTYDICGNSNMNQCAKAIVKYASEFFEEMLKYEPH